MGHWLDAARRELASQSARHSHPRGLFRLSNGRCAGRRNRRHRLKPRLAPGQILAGADRAWFSKANEVGIRQLSLPDRMRNTLLSTFVASSSVIVFSTIGLWMPPLLQEQHGFTAAEYVTFYIRWGSIGMVGICFAGWFIGKFGDRPGSAFMLLEASVFMTGWIFASGKTELIVPGLFRGCGLLGLWEPIITDTAAMYPTRSRSVGNGFSWTVAMFCGYVLWPFVSDSPRHTTGSFQAAFLLVPVMMGPRTVIIWAYSLEYAGGERDEIAGLASAPISDGTIRRLQTRAGIA